MIKIKDEHYISEGLARKCYFHPNDNNLCIKIGKPEVEVEHLYKEINYFKKIEKKKTSKFHYQFYAEYHGEVETNRGVGFVYSLVKDETSQNISLTLRHYLEMKNAPFKDDVFVEALDRLKQQMITHKVFVGDLRARNICCKILLDNSIELVVVDGLGHRDFLPFADWFGFFAKKKVERRFLRSKMYSLSAQRDLIKRMRENGATIV
ncbi:YrbL family protein [uncultured Algibacter sp.]|uniref:YrbL family protein n=1 Tax=uncultured Algibacter sp. TaxID=298659 RepID=UPI002619C59D|nr:YrbL family protein [uncultured Algibacter sp.]